MDCDNCSEEKLQCSDCGTFYCPNCDEHSCEEWRPDSEYAAGYAYACGYFD